MGAQRENLQRSAQRSIYTQRKPTFQDYMDAVASMHDLAECDRFMEGFRMGAKFMLDIFQPEIHFAHHDS